MRPAHADPYCHIRNSPSVQGQAKQQGSMLSTFLLSRLAPLYALRFWLDRCR